MSEPRAYYNEVDAYAAQWLRNLIAAGHITAGDVDTRSIVDVRPEDLVGYDRCHFFAGIGVWDYALGLAGWPAERPVWTGSCPCQPFSAAGKGGGFADERHLWPDWFWLVCERRPNTIFGEQAADAGGGAWVDLVRSDLEGAGYAFGVHDLPACGIGAPHIRQRSWFVADSESGERRKRQRLRKPQSKPGASRPTGRRGAVAGPYSNPEWLRCRDGKSRPAEPGTFPLAHGATSAVGRLRAYGNAINAEAGCAHIVAFMEARP